MLLSIFFFKSLKSENKLSLPGIELSHLSPALYPSRQPGTIDCVTDHNVHYHKFTINGNKGWSPRLTNNPQSIAVLSKWTLT